MWEVWELPGSLHGGRADGGFDTAVSLQGSGSRCNRGRSLFWEVLSDERAVPISAGQRTRKSCEPAVRLYLTFYLSDLPSLEDQTQNVTQFPSVKPAGEGLSKSHVSVCLELRSQVSISGSLSTTPPSMHRSGSPARITKHAGPKVALAWSNK